VQKLFLHGKKCLCLQNHEKLTFIVKGICDLTDGLLHWEKSAKAIHKGIQNYKEEYSLICWDLIWALTQPGPIWAYFWPAVNKRRTPYWAYVHFDPIRWDFFWPEGQKIEKFGIFRGNFPNPIQRWLTWPGSKKFDLDPSLVEIESHLGLLIVHCYDNWLKTWRLGFNLRLG